MIRQCAGTLNELSAHKISERVTTGEITAEAVVTDCLARIEAREDQTRIDTAAEVPGRHAHR